MHNKRDATVRKTIFQEIGFDIVYDNNYVVTKSEICLVLTETDTKLHSLVSPSSVNLAIFSLKSNVTPEFVDFDSLFLFKVHVLYC